jgi:plastocyanin
LVVLGLGSLLAGTARAQQAGDTLSVQCPPPKLLRQCVDFDATRAFDPKVGPQTFIWHLGDGTTLTGPKVSYCYKELRNYLVTLDVQNNRTKEIRKAEKTYQVALAEQEVLDFTQSATRVHVGEMVTFEAPAAVLPACENVQLIWDYRDGLQGRGRKVTHSFRKPGTFYVRLSLRAYGPGTCPSSHCVSREIVVVP